jgi:hypothetical protein
MVTFYDSDGIVSLYRDDFDLDAYYVRVLGEFLTRKLPSGIYNELIGKA